MGQRHKKQQESGGISAEEKVCGVEAAAPLVIVGAGSFLGDLIRLVRSDFDFKILGILDPSPTLKGQFVEDIPILGWIGDLPRHVSRVVLGNPTMPQGFDREAVFRLLLLRNITLPILVSSSARCAADVLLRRGTVVLPGAVVREGAVLGEDCIIGANAVVERCAVVADHGMVQPGETCVRGGQTPAAMTRGTVETTLAHERESIQEVMRRINWSSLEIVLVVDEKGALLGTITDGDIRRGILAGIEMASPVSMIMNPRPITVRLGASSREMLELMRRRGIRHLPVLDNQGRPAGLERLETIVDSLTGCNAVVMAGGMGTRLRPLTENVPKSLIPVAGRPILDHILEGLHSSGIDDVVLSLNYLGDSIRRHVGDGGRHQVNVSYVTERQRLGTAGALSLVQPRPRKPFLVMNGDLLTSVSYVKLLQFQKEHDHPLVMCVRQHSTQVPYGVVDIARGCVSTLREKPVVQHFINAGVYVLKPSCLDLIPKGKYFDMTDLIQVLLSKGESVGAFPIIEYWRDIGSPADLAAADAEKRAEPSWRPEAAVRGEVCA